MVENAVETLSHDVLIGRLLRAASAVSLRTAAEGFLASLVDGPLRHRSALGHLAFASNLPEHAFLPSRSQSYKCAICGASKVEAIDRDRLEKRLAKDETSLADPAAALVDLEGFARLPSAKPTPKDRACFDAMLAMIEALPPEARARDVIKGLRVPRSNGSARASIVEALGACGVFDGPDHVGHLTRWVGFWEHEEAPSSGETRPPEAWWRRAYGVSREALDHVFPFDGIDRARFPPRPAMSRPIVSRRVSVPKKGAQPALLLSPGDVVTFGGKGHWVAGVVLGAHEGPKRAHPVFEFYAEAFSKRPEAQALLRAAPRLVGPYREAPHARREPLALEGMEFLGGVMGVKVERIAEGHPVPKSAAVVSPYRVVATRNLLYLMATLAAPVPKLRA